MIHGHNNVAKLQTRKKAVKLQGGRGEGGESRAQGWSHGYGNGRKKSTHRLKERPPEIEEHSFIPPVNRHRLRGESVWLHPRGMSPKRARPRSGCSIWDPPLADRPRATQSLPDVVHYWDENELRNRVRRRRRWRREVKGGRELAMTPSRQG